MRLAQWVGRLLVAAALVELAVALVVGLTGGGVWRVGTLAVSATDATRPGVVACLLLLVRLLWRPPASAPALLLLPLLPLVGFLLAQSSPRRVGDGAEYVAMALNLSRGSPPSLTSGELARAASVFPGDTGFDLEMPAYRGADARQDFPHFWLYPLAAAPLVAIAVALGLHPVAGFTALNFALLAVATGAIVRRYGVMSALLLVAGPILWWIDKAHTEVSTFAVLTLAVVWLPSRPWWALVVLGAGAAQNPPLLIALAAALVAALAACGLRDRRVWAGAAAAAAVAAIHPLYYWVRLGRWSGLVEGVDRHVPSVRELITVAIDPNLGIFVLDPMLTIALLTMITLALVRGPRRRPSPSHLAAAAMAAGLLVAFTQTTNFNSGGTPGPSRYGLWLLPLTLPFIAGMPERAAWARTLVAASIAWSVVFFAPRAPDHYLEPTPLALALWTGWPSLDNPLAEVFAERVSGRDPSPPPPIATPGCEKVLLAGRGGQPAWPPGCDPSPAPAFCRTAGALCYANRGSGGYAFRRAPSAPAWRRTHTSS